MRNTTGIAGGWTLGVALIVAVCTGPVGPAVAPTPDAAGQAAQPFAAGVVALMGDVERGNRHYRAGRYEEAVAAYQAALEEGDDGPVLRYNLGTALLRLGRYQEAEEHFRRSLEVVDPEVREWAYYNLGHRFLEDARGQQDPQASVPLYDAAVESYRQAMRLRPQDQDAKWNYELALREREEQEQQGGGGDAGDEGGGGGQDEGDQEQQGGGQGQDGQSPGSQSQTPDSRSSSGEQPMSQDQADRILSGIEQDERELFRDKLRQGRRETAAGRDW